MFFQLDVPQLLNLREPPMPVGLLAGAFGRASQAAGQDPAYLGTKGALRNTLIEYAVHKIT